MKKKKLNSSNEVITYLTMSSTVNYSYSSFSQKTSNTYGSQNISNSLYSHNRMYSERSYGDGNYLINPFTRSSSSDSSSGSTFTLSSSRAAVRGLR